MKIQEAPNRVGIQWVVILSKPTNSKSQIIIKYLLHLVLKKKTIPQDVPH